MGPCSAATALTLPEDPSERLRAVLDVLWSDFSSSTFVVFVKLWVAAADDAELHERLIPLERQLARAVGELAATWSRELDGHADWDARLQLTLATLRGLALSQHFEPRGRRRRDPWPGVREGLLGVLAQAS